MLLQEKGLIQIIVNFRAEKNLCTFLMQQLSFSGMHKMCKKRLCSNSLETNELKVYKKKKLDLLISEKRYISPGACFFTTVLQTCTQNLSQGTQKIVYADFQYFQPLNLSLCELLIWMTHIYTYRRKEIEIIL